MVLPLLIFLVASTYAEHDHAQHIDKDFIVKEIVRSGKMPWTTMLHEIEERKSDLAKLKNKWKIDVENRSNQEDGYWEIWEKHYVPTYQKMADRFLIFTHVCEEMWEGRTDC
jgi:hypothetical protein